MKRRAEWEKGHLPLSRFTMVCIKLQIQIKSQNPTLKKDTKEYFVK